MVKNYGNPQESMNDDDQKDEIIYEKVTRAASSSAPRTHSPDQTTVDRLKQAEEKWNNMFQEQLNTITKCLDSITSKFHSKTLDITLVVTAEDIPNGEDLDSSTDNDPEGTTQLDNTMNIAALEQRQNIIESTQQIQSTKLEKNHKKSRALDGEHESSEC